jgi:hypothetical protein
MASVRELEVVRQRMTEAWSADAERLDRALALLHRFATENTGWRSFFWRWYYSDETLRNDAANLVREAHFNMPMPANTRLIQRGGASQCPTCFNHDVWGKAGERCCLTCGAHEPPRA